MLDLAALPLSPSLLLPHPGVRTWQGSFLQLPDYMGPADVVLLGWQAVSATAGADAAAARALLTKACLATRHGGHVVLARSSGGSSGGAGGLSREEVAQLTAGLPLALQQLAPEQQPWLAAVLQVPEHYRLAGGPVYLGGPVVTGFGRGSKKLGVPTANIDPAALDAHVASAPGGDRQAVPLPPGSALQRLPPGVYFGYAQLLDAPPGAPAADGQLHRMVMNIGRRPTVNTGQLALPCCLPFCPVFSSRAAPRATAQLPGSAASPALLLWPWPLP